MHETNRCTARNRHGAPCDRDGLAGAPFPICLAHAAEILRFLNSQTDQHADAAIAAARAIEAEDNCEPQGVVPGRGYEVVYYVRIGEHIKIGHSTNLAQRMRFYPPDAELLATEPGRRALEARRLRQFEAARKHREEWFTPTVALLRHIKCVAAARLAA